MNFPFFMITFINSNKPSPLANFCFKVILSYSGNHNETPSVFNQPQCLNNKETKAISRLGKQFQSKQSRSSLSTTNQSTTGLPSSTISSSYALNSSGKTCEGPSTPLVLTPVVSTPQKEPKQNPETSMDKVQKPCSESTAQVPPLEKEDSIFMEIPKPKAKKTINIEIQEPNSPRPNSYQPKLPYPERMKVKENDKPSAQHSQFLKMFKQLRLEIGLKDALVKMSKFNKWLSSLLRNKEKLKEIAITTVNAECSAIIINKVPRTAQSREISYPCGFT
ncbi:hypothetical protein Tco_0721959 [Tanacetum coccineum]